MFYGMIGMLYSVYSEMALARAVIAECLLVSSPHSDFSPSWARLWSTSWSDKGVQCHTDLATCLQWCSGYPLWRLVAIRDVTYFCGSVVFLLHV